jgi:hypothetical protein
VADILNKLDKDVNVVLIKDEDVLYDEYVYEHEPIYEDECMVTSLRFNALMNLMCIYI